MVALSLGIPICASAEPLRAGDVRALSVTGRTWVAHACTLASVCHPTFVRTQTVSVRSWPLTTYAERRYCQEASLGSTWNYPVKCDSLAPEAKHEQ